MNTGVQRSSASPYGAWTTTTPAATYKSQEKKKIMEIMAAHRIPYAATATIAYPEDLMNKVRKAAGLKGMKFLHILCPCPTGWKSAPDLAIELSRKAVQSRVFNLYEITGGTRYRLTFEPEKELPVAEYIKPQGRFAHLTEEDISRIQEQVDKDWERLKRTVEIWPL
jgi:pyruvate/2-oxoacid:ferredoxin oxidoreductase beta subunit